MWAGIFGVLLLANLAVFLWGYQHQVPLQPELPPLPPDVTRLELVPETPAKSPAAEAGRAENGHGNSPRRQVSSDTDLAVPGVPAGQ